MIKQKQSNRRNHFEQSLQQHLSEEFKTKDKIIIESKMQEKLKPDGKRNIKLSKKSLKPLGGAIVENNNDYMSPCQIKSPIKETGSDSKNVIITATFGGGQKFLPS